MLSFASKAICLSTAIVSDLLQLVQTIQEGKLVSFDCDVTSPVGLSLPYSEMPINGTKHFVAELLDIFEIRRDQGHIEEIVTQTLRFASLDASIQDHEVVPVFLRSDHVVSAVFLTAWMKLLKLANVSNGFASALANVDNSNQCMP